MEILSYLGTQITGFGKAFLNTFIKGPEELASFAIRCCLTKPCACTSTDWWLIVLMLEHSWRSDVCFSFLSWLFSSPGSMSMKRKMNIQAESHPSCGKDRPFEITGPSQGWKQFCINRQFTREVVLSATEILTLVLHFGDLRQWPSLNSR